MDCKICFDTVEYKDKNILICANQFAQNAARGAITFRKLYTKWTKGK